MHENRETSELSAHFTGIKNAGYLQRYWTSLIDTAEM
jgi:hypothetical protein